MSMLQDRDKDKRNLIVYDMLTGSRYLLRASKPSLRDSWLEKSSQLIQKAKADLSKELALRSRSVSEPAEFARSFSFSKNKHRRDRDEARRSRVKRPSSSTGVRSTTASEEIVSHLTSHLIPSHFSISSHLIASLISFLFPV